MALNIGLHKEKMLTIVQAIFRSPIGKYCGFKGGTLALFLYHLDRFSTDVDIDLINQEREQEVIEVITGLLEELGSVKSFMVGKTLHRRIFRYDLTGMNIKVELNKRVRNNNKYEIRSIYGVDCKVMQPISIATNKLVALSNRFANRDLYDTWFFRTLGREYDPALILERTEKDIRSFIQECIDFIPERYTENTILFQLGEVLSDKQKAWVKQHLVDETINKLMFYRDNL